ncbi:similar to solute carrier protein [Cyanidioschyzon merolae strain 10D]|uniref:Similar to solute carrier protein n=1 Tax=Cyanidioschyzon merolae (strain NIES-3377 / 10D) TaxID=280699 RepID=M1V633_CYAM1|nr:similar to solute carrier protein [Cyanidioschyzon merolae strain 10D]BAM81720.1 similar to solute carrier protein [Cyanidioschyzon merolae strain 10D]|eukprot:XP_005537756.1 similar to solute carrier protein [Cyanidioschyzon merolae strain 10D]
MSSKENKNAFTKTTGTVIAVSAGAATTTGVDALSQLTFTEKLLAGSSARGVAQTLLHPIDVVRTRLQARGVRRDWSPRVFIKGVIPQVVLAVPAGGVQFVAYEWCKQRLTELLLPPASHTKQASTKVTSSGRNHAWRQVVVDLVSGAAGAFAASFIRVPQEVLKQRIQADLYPHIGVALPTILQKEGFGGLYRGYWATVSRDVPWNALSFLFFLQESRLFERIQKRAPNRQENLVLAAIGGATAALMLTPVDVVKTRLMTQGADGTYRGILPTFRRIIAEEGPATLMKGSVPRVMYLAPLAAITLTIYNAIGRKLLEARKRRVVTLAPRFRGIGHGYQVACAKRSLFVFERNLPQCSAQVSYTL